MSVEEEEKSFSFEWRIKNFSMCPAEFGSFISSPVIRVKMLDNTEWDLKLYPKGCAIKGFIACFLRCVNPFFYENLQMELKIYVFPEQPNLRYEKLLKRFGCWGCNKVISIEEVLKDKDRYLPNDTLKIIYSMKCKNRRRSHNRDGEVFNALLRESGKNYLHLNKCSIETIIGVQHRSRTWPIQKFQSLSVNERITMPFYSFMIKVPSLYLTVYKTAESSVRIEISKEMCCLTNNTIVRCYVSVANHPNGAHCRASGEIFFSGTNKVWKFPNLRHWSVVDDEYFKHTGGTLYLHFKFSSANIDGIQHFERPDRWYPDQPLSERPSQSDLSTVLTATDETVTLRAEGDSFTVHAPILKASSRVFDAMFDNEMKEKLTGVVEINDTNSETLKQMVSFFYSGTVGEISPTECRNLYALAHKYQVKSLMILCSSNLASSLTTSNLCDLLCFANLYHDDRLWKSAQAFFIDNSDRVLVSPEWKNFMKAYSSLAVQVMYNKLVKGDSNDFY